MIRWFTEKGFSVGADKKRFSAAKVVWFNDDKGMGYAEDASGNLILIHYSSIVSDDKSRRTLRKDQEVKLQFTEEFGELRATKVIEVGGNA